MDQDEKTDLVEVGKACECDELCTLHKARAHDSKQPLGRKISTNHTDPWKNIPRTRPAKRWGILAPHPGAAHGCALSSRIFRSSQDYSSLLTIWFAWLIWCLHFGRTTWQWTQRGWKTQSEDYRHHDSKLHNGKSERIKRQECKLLIVYRSLSHP